MKRKLFFAWMCICIMLPAYVQAQNEIKKVAIMEVVDRDGAVEQGIKLMLRGKLSEVIAKTPGYEGYDRVDVGAIMDAQSFQRTGMVNDEQVKKLGEMSGADYLLIAEVAYVNQYNFVITAKLLNVETGKLDATVTTTSESYTDRIELACQHIANELFHLDKQASKAEKPSKVDLIIYYPGGDPSCGKRYSSKVSVYMDKKLIGKGTFGQGFKFSMEDTSPGDHEITFKWGAGGICSPFAGSQKMYINTLRNRYYELGLREEYKSGKNPDGSSYAYYVYSFVFEKKH